MSVVWHGKIPMTHFKWKSTEQQYTSNMIFIKKAEKYYLYLTLKASDKW